MEENNQNKEPLNKDFKEPKLRFKDFSGSYILTRLKSISKIVGGGTPNTAVKEYWDGCINWFTPTEIGENKYVSESIRKLTDSGFKNSSAKMIEPYSILMTSRASIGLVSINMTSCCTNQGFQSIIPTDIELDYLYYLILTNKFQHELIRRSTKSTFLEISHSEISKITVSLPSNKSEQKKVASLLNKIDEKIDVLINKISTLKKYRKGIQKIAFRRTPNEAYVKLKSLVSFMPKSKLSAGNSSKNGKYPFYLSGEKIGTINSFMYEGCYIIANDGGEAGFRLSNGPFAYSDHCICFQSANEWTTRNIYEYLDSQKNKITYVGFLGSGLKNIDRSYLQNFKIPLSIENKQLAIMFSLFDERIRHLENELLRLKATKRYLLANMFI